MRILIPVNENKNSLAAVDFVASRSALLVGPVPDVVLFNVQEPIHREIGRVLGAKRLRGIYEASAEKALDPARRTLGEANLIARTAFAAGTPGREIAAAAKKHRADLIVMAARGLPAVRGLFVDAVTPTVLAHTKTPVLLLRGRTVRKQKSLHLGVAVDGSSYGWAAIKYVRAQRALFGPAPRITLIHVAPELAPYQAGGFAVEKMRSSDFEAALEPARKLLRNDDCEFDEATLAGDAGERIAACAKDRRLDLLVMGSHGRGAFRSAIVGSVVMRVAERCATPLLIVRRT